ncbi:MAG: toprim domain-containing protein [Candidatus Anstonellales archaeon]
MGERDNRVINYGQNSISSLKNEEQVRKRPAVMLGNNGIKGVYQAIYEIIANSIDEAREGYGNQIRVSMFKDGIVEVSDDGRGVPMGWNEKEGKYNWELVFCTLYASGKYDDSNYKDSAGLNGVGATATQYASEFMEVYSTRDGKTYIMKFEKGRPVGSLKEVSPIREGTGTTIRFKPDREVFTGVKEIVLEPAYFIDLLRRQAMLHDGLEFIYYHEELGKSISIRYENGIRDFIQASCNKSLLKEVVEFRGSAYGTDDEEINPEKYKVDMRLAFTFSRESSLLEMYHNGIHLHLGGVTLDALKNSMVKAFEDYAKSIGKLQKNDKILFRDIESILVAVGDTNAPGNRTFFEHQTKAAIHNPFIKQAYQEFIYNNLMVWLKNNEEGEVVLEEVLANKRAREEADRVSKKVVQNLSKGVGFGNKPKKFVDCSGKSGRELYIVEGDSALGSCKLARNAEFQAIMPIRGKIINCLKGDITEILNNDVIIDLLRVIGCGIEVESKAIEGLPVFDINKLSWDKIIICTDADLDGMQIRCLILTMFYRLMPTLLREGKVYIVESHLYEINYKGKYYLAYSDEEKQKIIEKLISEGAKLGSIKVQRSKGLGENNPDMMNISTMNPKTRRLIPVEFNSNEEEVRNCFNALLGVI